MSESSVTIENGWALYAHPLFIERLTDLVREVKKLIARDPENFHRHPHFELFEGVVQNVLQNVPMNPAAPKYRQGVTLGRENQHWFRVKKNNLPPRYRLFFQFRSEAPKTIIYAWLNDESTIRRAGDRRDVYVVFKAMLANKRMPNSYEALRKACSPLARPDLGEAEDS